MSTKAQLTASCEQYAADNAALQRALNAIMDGEVSPAFRKGDYTLRLVDWNGASGGVVIVTYAPKCNAKPYTSAHFWERWYQVVGENVIASHEDTEAHAVREVAFKAAQWMREAQRKVAA